MEEGQRQERTAEEEVDARLVNVNLFCTARGVVKIFGAILDGLTKAIEEVEHLEMILEIVQGTDLCTCALQHETNPDAIVERFVEFFAFGWGQTGPSQSLREVCEALWQYH